MRELSHRQFYAQNQRKNPKKTKEIKIDRIYDAAASDFPFETKTNGHHRVPHYYAQCAS